MADTPTGETVTPGDSQTQATTTSAPVTDNAGAAEVERLRKEKEQADMRARQLENQLKAKEEADREAEAKRLEEQEEWKQLAEKREAELNQLRDTQAAAERATELSNATDSIFKDYPTEVVEIAKTAGLGLSDDGEVAQKALKDKLDAIKQRVNPGTTVTSSNPNPVSPAETGETGGLGRPKSLGVDDGNTTVHPDADPTKVRDYLSSLQAVKRMKLDSGHFREVE